MKQIRLTWSNIKEKQRKEDAILARTKERRRIQQAMADKLREEDEYKVETMKTSNGVWCW